jgi:hypothetical protein
MQDATVQSIPQMSQAPAVAPSSYVVPAQSAPAPSYQAAPVPYQVGMSYPQAVPQAAPSYQSAPTPYAPQYQPADQSQSSSAGNPWESAFNKVVNLLSAPVQSPFQGQPSAPTPQYAPANYGQVSSPATQQSAPQTWQANPAYSPSSSPTYLTGSSAAQAHAEVNSAVADYYNLSQESRQVIDAFGMEAPAVLNNYALNLEGMLDSAVAWGNKAASTIQGYAEFSVNEHQENLAYNEILTNPDVLSDYTLKFFGPEGPYPVYENERQLETPGYRTQPVAYEQGQFPAPPSAAAAQQPENFWGSFKDMMDRDPQNAWRVINQAQPQVLANKLFVME